MLTQKRYTQSGNALSRSLDTFLKSGGQTYIPASHALNKKISLGSSKSGPCKACQMNQKTGAKQPPLHPNCRCSKK